MAIKEVIEKIVGDTVVLTVVSGTVTKITGDTCTVVSDHDGREYFNVSFNALAEQKDDRLIVTPKLKSKVTLGVYPNGKDAVLLAFSEVDSFQFKRQNTLFNIDADGFRIERNGEDLKSVINDYIDEVNKIVVVQGTSINIVATTAIKTRLNQLLK